MSFYTNRDCAEYMSATQQIDTNFHEYFQPVLATSEEQLQEVFRIRYQVYCQEFEFEREEDCPNQMERDEYDHQSLHCLLIHQPSGRAAGCVRLVLNDPKNPESRLPLLSHCRESIDRSIIDPDKLPSGSYGEISRLAVISDFRRRKKERETPIGNTSEDIGLSLVEQRHFPFIALGLYLSAASTGMLTGLQGVFAMMEPRLARLLSRFGIRFTQVGKVVDYHGPRAPFYITRDDLLYGIKPEISNLLDLIKVDLENEFKRNHLKTV